MEYIIWAMGMGRTAYEQGIACAPILDSEFMELALTSQNPSPLMASWIRGWTQANLEA